MNMLPKFLSIVFLSCFYHLSCASDWNIEKAYYLAIAAKCSYSSNKTETISCLKIHPKYSGVKETDIYLWRHDSRPDAYLLINTPKELILAIRGTQPPIKLSLNVSYDWLNDTIIGGVDNYGYHKGFYRII